MGHEEPRQGEARGEAEGMLLSFPPFVSSLVPGSRVEKEDLSKLLQSPGRFQDEELPPLPHYHSSGCDSDTNRILGTSHYGRFWY